MRVTLAVTEGPHQGQQFEFREHDTFLVGRAKQARFRLPAKDPSLSRYHFLVEVNPPHCRLMDMASTNGTYVNGERVYTIDLRHGDRIKAGRTTLRVEVEESGTAVMSTRGGELDWRPLNEADLPAYRIERELGRGGMGVVYLARSQADGTPAALKMIEPAVACCSGALGRLLREASILRRLDHPRIVRFLDLGLAHGAFYFAMEYVPGVDACDYLRRRGGALPVAEAVDLASQALEAMDYAHGLGYVHRDIKPQNLLIADGPDGRPLVKLADFGLARLYQSSVVSGLTLMGDYAGTLGYMPPEQILSFRDARQPVDQYALGATLYYLLTGSKVHDFPDGPDQKIMTVLQCDAVPLRRRRPDLPEALEAVLARALARDPEARYPTAHALREALTPFAA